MITFLNNMSFIDKDCKLTIVNLCISEVNGVDFNN